MLPSRLTGTDATEADLLLVPLAYTGTDRLPSRLCIGLCGGECMRADTGIGFSALLSFLRTSVDCPRADDGGDPGCVCETELRREGAIEYAASSAASGERVLLARDALRGLAWLDDIPTCAGCCASKYDMVARCARGVLAPSSTSGVATDMELRRYARERYSAARPSALGAESPDNDGTADMEDLRPLLTSGTLLSCLSTSTGFGRAPCGRAGRSDMTEPDLLRLDGDHASASGMGGGVDSAMDG